jgi:hypothetical protein
MNKGMIAWVVANGDTPAAVKSNPLLQGLTIPKTGTNRNVGILVTKTMLFAGDGTDPLFDAYDKETGALIAQIPMPAMQTGMPMTYVHQGRQFILLSVGAANGQGPQMVAYALPAPAAAGGAGRGARGGAQAPATPAAGAGATPAAPAGGRGGRGATPAPPRGQ